MNSLRQRPLLTLCGSLALAAFCLRRLPAPGKVACLVLVALGMATLLILRALSRPERRVSLLPLLPLLMGLFLGCFSSWLDADVRIAAITARDGEKGALTGEVTEVVYQADYASLYRIRIREWQGQRVSFGALLEIPGECDADVGDGITLSATLSRLPEWDNGFPTRSYYAAEGIFLAAVGEEEGTVTVTEGQNGLASGLHRFAATVAARFRLTFGEERGGFLSGILLGRKDDVAESTRRDFRFLGLSHVLAVSGLHLAVLVGGLLLFLRLIDLPPWLRLVLATVLIVLVALVTGLPASVLRSGIMLFLTLLASLLGERYDPPTALGVAAAGILLISPTAVLDVGFQLSVSATAGLIAMGSPLSSRILSRTAKSPWLGKLLGRALSALALTVSAVFFTLPFSAVYFGECSVVSPLSNLLFLPFMGPMLLLAVLSALTYGTPLQAFCDSLTGGISEGLLTGAKTLASAVIEPVSLRYDFALFAFLLTAIALILLFLMKKPRTVTLLSGLLVFSLSFGVGYGVYRLQEQEIDRVVAVNLGKNDYLLLHRDGKTLLCDMSDGSYSSLKSAASLSSDLLCDSSPDGLFLTHLHRKHASTFPRLADRHRFSYLILPAPYDDVTEETAALLTQEAEARGITVIVYASHTPATVAFAGYTLTTSPIAFLDRSVQPLCTLTVRGNGTLLYLGGGVTESEQREAALALADQAHVTLLGAHGPLVKKPLEHLPTGTLLVANPSVGDSYAVTADSVREGDGFFRLLVFRRAG